MWFMEYYWTSVTSCFQQAWSSCHLITGFFGILTSCYWSIPPLPEWAPKYMDRGNLLSFFLFSLETFAHALRQRISKVGCLTQWWPVLESKLLHSWILWCYPLLRAMTKSHLFQCSFSFFSFLVPQILLNIEFIFRYTCQTKYSLQHCPIFLFVLFAMPWLC